MVKIISTITLIILWSAPKIFVLPQPIKLSLTILYFSIALYFGLKGDKIALKSGRYRDKNEFAANKKSWSFAAMIWIIAYVVLGNIWHSAGAGTNIFRIGLDAINSH